MPQGWGFKDHAHVKAAQYWPGARFKASVTIWDYNSYVGLGVKCSKEVATDVLWAIILAKLFTVPVWWGYWGKKRQVPQRPCNVPASVLSTSSYPQRHWHRLCLYAQEAAADGQYGRPPHLTRVALHPLVTTTGATCDAISKTYSCLTPDFWKEIMFTTSPNQEASDLLLQTHTKTSLPRTLGCSYGHHQSDFIQSAFIKWINFFYKVRGKKILKQSRKSEGY